METIAALDIIREDPKFGATDCNHVFMNLVPVIPSDSNQMMENIVLMLKKHGEKIFRLRITEVHFTFLIQIFHFLDGVTCFCDANMRH